MRHNGPSAIELDAAALRLDVSAALGAASADTAAASMRLTLEPQYRPQSRSLREWSSRVLVPEGREVYYGRFGCAWPAAIPPRAHQELRARITRAGGRTSPAVASLLGLVGLELQVAVTRTE